MTIAPRIGIDLGGTKISGVVLDIEPDRDTKPRCYRRVPTPRGSYADTLDAIDGLVQTLTEDFRGVSDVALQRTIGIGTPGASSPQTGRMSNCNSTWLNGERLQADLVERLQRPVVLANDADCFALAQWRLQGAASDGLLFGVILGTGVGGGWIDRGRLRQGPNLLSGEWGHTPLPYLRQADGVLASLESGLPDRDCYCGRRNCIETFLSGPGLYRTYQQLWGTESSEPDAAAVIASTDAQCRQTFELYCDMLARSLAQVVNAVDPDLIVLGGGLSNATLLYDALPGRMPRYLFDRTQLRTPIKGPISGADSGVIGAALLCDGLINQEQ